MLPAARFTRGGGAGAGDRRPGRRRQGAGQHGRRRHAGAAGACTAAGRRWSTSARGWPASSATRCRSTPTSPRRRTRASRRTTTSTTCSCCRSPAASSGRSTRRWSTTRWTTSRGRSAAPRSPPAPPRTPLIDTVLEPGDALYLPRGTIHAAQALGETSIHLTVGVHPVTRYQLVRHLLDLAQDDPRCAPRCRWASTSPTRPCSPSTWRRPSRRCASASTRTAPARRGRAASASTCMRRTRPEPIGPLAQLGAADALTPTPRCGCAARCGSGSDADGDELRLVLLDRTVSAAGGDRRRGQGAAGRRAVHARPSCPASMPTRSSRWRAGCCARASSSRRVNDADRHRPHPRETLDRCALRAQLRGDPMLGTAFPAARLLLVEQPGPWGASGLRESRFDRVAAAALEARAGARRASGCRRSAGRAARRAARVRRWALVDTRDGRESLRWGTYGDRRRAARPAARRLRRATPTPTPLYLVCAHSKHDTCCALRGRPVAAALAELRPGRVWECSHLGGDRFAANVLVLPVGLLYGRVLPFAAPEFVAAAEAGEVVGALLRGRVGLPPAPRPRSRSPTSTWRCAAQPRPARRARPARSSTAMAHGAAARAARRARRHGAGRTGRRRRADLPQPAAEPLPRLPAGEHRRRSDRRSVGPASRLVAAGVEPALPGTRRSRPRPRSRPTQSAPSTLLPGSSSL